MESDSPQTFFVRVTVEAALDLEAIGDYIAIDSPERAARFISRVRTAITKLSSWPRRYAKARESDDLPVKELRQAVVGDYRIIFQVDRDAVYILHVRHASRKPFTQDGFNL